MSIRGGKPKPTVIKMLEGNAGKRPLNKREPNYRSVNIKSDCPPDLVGDARDEWVRMLAVIGNQVLVTAGDVAVFTLYCASWGEYITAQRAVNALTSWTIETDSGIKPHPLLGIRDRAAAVMKKAALEFGLTPSSRTRIELPDKTDGDEVDDYEKFQNKGFKISG